MYIFMAMQVHSSCLLKLAGNELASMAASHSKNSSLGGDAQDNSLPGGQGASNGLSVICRVVEFYVCNAPGAGLRLTWYDMECVFSSVMFIIENGDTVLYSFEGLCLHTFRLFA